VTARIRKTDKILVDVLHNQLSDYLHKDVPKEKLSDVLTTLMQEVRKTSRKATNRIYLEKDFFWDKELNRLVYQGEVLKLTKKERELLMLLFQDTEQDFRYETILSALWGEVSPSKQDSLKTLVKQLRRKLPKNFIQNIFGYGYTIRV
jgi:DNA-binding response OmpR family regulator